MTWSASTMATTSDEFCTRERNRCPLSTSSAVWSSTLASRARVSVTFSSNVSSCRTTSMVTTHAEHQNRNGSSSPVTISSTHATTSDTATGQEGSTELKRLV